MVAATFLQMYDPTKSRKSSNAELLWDKKITKINSIKINFRGIAKKIPPEAPSGLWVNFPSGELSSRRF
jgi:hypothetical protein